MGNVRCSWAQIKPVMSTPFPGTPTDWAQNMIGRVYAFNAAGNSAPSGFVSPWPGLATPIMYAVTRQVTTITYVPLTNTVAITFHYVVLDSLSVNPCLGVVVNEAIIDFPYEDREVSLPPSTGRTITTDAQGMFQDDFLVSFYRSLWRSLR